MRVWVEAIKNRAFSRLQQLVSPPSQSPPSERTSLKKSCITSLKKDLVKKLKTHFPRDQHCKSKSTGKIWSVHVTLQQNVGRRIRFPVTPALRERNEEELVVGERTVWPERWPGAVRHHPPVGFKRDVEPAVICNILAQGLSPVHPAAELVHKAVVLVHQALRALVELG